MSAHSSNDKLQGEIKTVSQAALRHWPALLALLAIGVIYMAISQELAIGPRGLLLGIIVVLLIPWFITVRTQRLRMTRGITFTMLGVATVAEAASTSFLVTQLLMQTNPAPETAISLLRDAGLIWVVNILTFALWYWEIDDGGPGHRHRDGYHMTDFVFPQMTLDQTKETGWYPEFVDYLFLAFNTSTAFSPTDTLVLSRRTKLLMMAQALISLVVLAVIAARAINTL